MPRRDRCTRPARCEVPTAYVVTSSTATHRGRLVRRRLRERVVLRGERLELRLHFARLGDEPVAVLAHAFEGFTR